MAKDHLKGSSDVVAHDMTVLDDTRVSSPSLEQANGEPQTFLSGYKLYLIVLGLSLSVLLVALAIPTITTRFNSLDDVGWYGSAFLITICACQPLAGKIYQYYSLKWAYLTFLLIFEIGSLICAVSPSSVVLIIGRAVAGIGAAGLFSGALVIIAHSIPMKLRPVYTGVIASMFGIANVIGPVLGGALTQHVSWRWCFYINLPCGAVTSVLLIIFFQPPNQKNLQLSIRKKFSNLDLPGFFIFVPAVVMLLLALQWGGNIHAWKSATIIGLLCGFAIMIMAFGFWQWRQQDLAGIPPSVITQRSVLCGSINACLCFGGLQLLTYFLPIWFQVIKDATPTHSGIMYFPSVLGNVVMSLMAGLLVTKLGYYNPWIFLGSALLCIGAGLLSTLTPSSKSAYWFGYQVIAGAGIGSVLQMPLIAVQAVLPLSKVSLGTSVVVVFQFLGGAIFLAIGQNVFQTELVKQLMRQAPDLDPLRIVHAGAGNVRMVVSPENLEAVLGAYNIAITSTFYVVVGGAALAFFAAGGMQWVNVRGMSLIPSEP